MSQRSLRGSRIIITGASSGIGCAMAYELNRQGADLVLTARRAERLETLVDDFQSHGGKAIALPGDITDGGLRARLVQKAVDELGGLDILINNAGCGAIGPFAAADEGRLRKIMEVNFFAVTELTRAALPALRLGKQPMIVNIGSVLGHCAVPNKSEYCASKFALHGFSDALREELRGEGIDVLLVSPSTTESEFFEQAIGGDSVGAKANPFPMSAAAVAKQSIKAIRRGRREIILSSTGKLLVWSDRLFPSLVSWVLSRR